MCRRKRKNKPELKDKTMNSPKHNKIKYTFKQCLTSFHIDKEIFIHDYKF